MVSKRLNFRKRLEQKEILVAPGAYDSLFAKIIEREGFEAVYVSGASASYSLLGQPDVGLITLSEMVSRAAYICEAIDIPVIADADTGYGNPINVRRTVQLYEKAGVSALHIEDQVFPKRCGHLDGKEMISVEEMVQKIKAATDARTDENFLIIARTDARAVEGLDRAIERANEYVRAGADVIFVEAPQSVEEMKEINKRIDALTMANMVEGGKTPLLPVSELEDMGYDLVIFPNSITRIISKAATKLMRELKEKGTTEACIKEMFLFKDLTEILGIDEFKRLEKKYVKG